MAAGTALPRSPGRRRRARPAATAPGRPRGARPGRPRGARGCPRPGAGRTVADRIRAVRSARRRWSLRVLMGADRAQPGQGDVAAAGLDPDHPGGEPYGRRALASGLEPGKPDLRAFALAGPRLVPVAQ